MRNITFSESFQPIVDRIFAALAEQGVNVDRVYFYRDEVFQVGTEEGYTVTIYHDFETDTGEYFWYGAFQGKYSI